MWSYIKIPFVDPDGNSGVVCLEKYFVVEDEIVRAGDRIALIHTDNRTYEVISNYSGKILKLILHENTMVGFRDPIATLELTQDPVDGLLIERSQLINSS